MPTASRQYHRLKGEPTRTKFISLKKGYHGTHFGGASVNGNNRFRINYEPPARAVSIFQALIRIEIHIMKLTP